MAILVASRCLSAGDQEYKDRRLRNGGKVVRTGAVDSYEMLHKIDEGAYGAVWKARHILTGELVAIKSSLRPGGEAALLQEAAMLAACAGDPAVVRLLEVARGSAAHEVHLVMEYVGRSLYDVMRSRRRCGRQFSERETRRAMRQLLGGAAGMHARGVVHRDLKPGNVLVGEADGRLKICDLGLARPAAAAPPADTDDELEGTLGYMAPEVLLREKGCGAHADEWALGCIMAELVAGRPLFQEEDSCLQLVSIVRLLGIPDEVSSLPLGVSPPGKLRETAVEERLSPAGFDVLRGLLEYDPKDRLSAAAALKMPWFVQAQDD